MLKVTKFKMPFGEPWKKKLEGVSKVQLLYTVDGHKVPKVHRRLICQNVSVSRNLSQKVIPSDA